MNETIQKFLKALLDIKAAANASLKELPPIEQHEATPDIAFAIRCMMRVGADFAAVANGLSEKLSGISAELVADPELQKQVLAKLVELGTVIPKTDHDAAVSAAVNTKAVELRQEFENETKRKDLVFQRRSEISTLLPGIAAERVSDTVLAADDYKELVDKIKGRIDKVAELGVTAEAAPDVVADIASLPLDETGDQQFTQRIGFMSAAVSAQKSKPTDNKVINPAAIGGSKTTTTVAVTPVGVPEGIKSHLI